MLRPLDSPSITGSPKGVKSGGRSENPRKWPHRQAADSLFGDRQRPRSSPILADGESAKELSCTRVRSAMSQLEQRCLGPVSQKVKKRSSVPKAGKRDLWRHDSK